MTTAKEYPLGGYNLLETLGIKIGKNSVKAIVLVDRKQKLSDNPEARYRFRVLSVIAFVNSLHQLFDYNECKNKAEYFDTHSKGDESFFNCLQQPFIFEYTFNQSKSTERTQRLLNDYDLEYYEKIKQQFNLGDPYCKDDGFIHFNTLNTFN